MKSISDLLNNFPIETETPKDSFIGSRMCPLAYTSRVIYGESTGDKMELSMKPMRIANGRYTWNPDGESFDMLLYSVWEQVEELCKDLPVQSDEDGMTRKNYLQHLLMQEFIDPVQALMKLRREAYVDEQGRKVYVLSGNVECTVKESANYEFLRRLKKDEMLMPLRFHHQRLVLSDLNKNELGLLSFSQSELYYIVIPLLRRKMAQVKITVEQVQESEYEGHYRVSAQLKLLLRLLDESQMSDATIEQLNEQIEKALH
ncbi:MAG: hypothetical protein K6C69_07735 [Lachnospiraceae bacterium]|nr:hypothetical protein [Lachnospiraceae bacterium]